MEQRVKRCVTKCKCCNIIYYGWQREEFKPKVINYSSWAPKNQCYPYIEKEEKSRR
jgi:hypothetical protein